MFKAKYVSLNNRDGKIVLKDGIVVRSDETIITREGSIVYQSRTIFP